MAITGPRSSCVQRIPDKRFICLREEQLEICDGDHCAAVLLGVFEYLTNGRLWSLEVPWTHEPSEKLLIRISYEELGIMAMGLFGRGSIIKAVGLLVERGFLSTDTPRNRQSKVAYLLHFEKVNMALGHRPKMDDVSSNLDDHRPKMDDAYKEEERIEELQEERGGKPKTLYCEEGEFDHFLDRYLRQAGHKPASVSEGLRKQFRRLDRSAKDQEVFRALLVHAIVSHNPSTRTTIGEALYAFRVEAEGLEKAPRPDRVKPTYQNRNLFERTREESDQWIKELAEEEKQKTASKPSGSSGKGS